MRIAHVCTYWPIGTGLSLYADNLIHGMRAHRPERHTVLAEVGSAPTTTDAVECVPCYNRKQDYVEGIVAAAQKTRPDVAIIQYSPDLFGNDNRMPRLVARLRELGIRPVVNMHSVFPETWRSGYRPGGRMGAFDRALAEHASLITVHTPRMKHDLLTRGIAPDKIEVVPHGSPRVTESDVAHCRTQLNIERSAKVILFFGFIWTGKGLAFLLDVFRDVLREVPEAYLLIGGHTRARIWSSYITYLKARAALLGISHRTRFWGGFVPRNLSDTVYGAADVVAMPYLQDYSSVSGVMHETASMGKLMLCSRIAKFDEVETSIDRELCVPTRDLQAWTKTLVRLLRDETWAHQLREKLRRFAEHTSWENVGRMHWDLYDRLFLASPTVK
jgi:glycosyltransferase involved in cell wall biosynthesis